MIMALIHPTSLRTLATRRGFEEAAPGGQGGRSSVAALFVPVLLQPVALHAPRWFIARDRIGMHIGRAIHIGPRPGMIVHDHFMIDPAEPHSAPAPRPERGADGHPRAERDRAADKKSRPRRHEHHRRIIDRSEERRVGKECRSRWSPYHSKKKKKK